MSRHTLLPLAGLVWLLAACGGNQRLLPGSLLVTQVPAGSQIRAGDASSPGDLYPPGTRVVLVTPPFGPRDVKVLSEGLVAAGGVACSPGGTWAAFAGQEEAGQPWQLFAVDLPGGRPRKLTRLEGGATDPAFLADESLIFISKVAGPGSPGDAGPSAALFRLDAGEQDPRRLTFGLKGVAGPTVLRDGRLLFVAAQPGDKNAHRALFTVNPDGTCLLPFGAHHQGPGELRRPRELEDGRVIFLGSGSAAKGWEVEQLLAARPFHSRGPIQPPLPSAAQAVEPTADGSFLVSLPRQDDGAAIPTKALYLATPAAETLLQLCFDDPAWDEVEGVPARPRTRPRLLPSRVEPDRHSGLLLCLDARPRETSHSREGAALPSVRSVRVLIHGEGGVPQALGEVPVQSDGSFLAEVPADMALGFESLDEEGRTLSRLPPAVWVRPGEVRSCPGCHAAHGRTPANRRPLALDHPAEVIAPPATHMGGGSSGL